MYTVDPRAVKNEQYQLKDVRKLVGTLPEFPSEPKPREPLDDLETFAKSVLKVMAHMTVRTALTSWSCLPERPNMAVMTNSDVMAMISEDRLAKAQQQYLEESAPGGSCGDTWRSRYDSTSRFLADLALSLGIPVTDMMRYKRDLLGEKQRDGEGAAQFYSRVNTRYQTVRFLAESVDGCSDISHLELTGLYLDGLRHRTRVLRKLDAQGVDPARPHLWEQAQKNRNSSETSAILKIRQVATDLEADKVKEDAALSEAVVRQVAQEMAQRGRSSLTPRSTANPPRPFNFARRRPMVAAIQEPQEGDTGQVAAVRPEGSRPSPAAAAGGIGAQRPPWATRERPCFACGSTDHLVANCDNAAKLAAWRANAPSRLANTRRSQVVACLAAVQDESLYSDLGDEDLAVMDEISDLTDVDESTVLDLCALCGYDPSPFHNGGSAGTSGKQA